MIKNDFWPIPEDQIVDGSVISLRNAYRLSQDAKILLKQNRYSTATVIATLALEEFGKHCVLSDIFSSPNSNSIDKSIWEKKFKNHRYKLLAIPEQLGKFPGSSDKHVRKKLDEMTEYLSKLSMTKLKSLYVDWNASEGHWFYYDEDSPDKVNMAQKAVNTANWAIDMYLEDMDSDKELKLMLPKELRKLLDEGKIHSFCCKCATKIRTKSELLKHSKDCSMGSSWYWS